MGIVCDKCKGDMKQHGSWKSEVDMPHVCVKQGMCVDCGHVQDNVFRTLWESLYENAVKVNTNTRRDLSDDALFRATNTDRGVKLELLPTSSLEAHAKLDWSKGKVHFVKVIGYEKGCVGDGDYTDDLSAKPAKAEIGVEEYVSQAKIDTCCACDCSLEPDERHFERTCETCALSEDYPSNTKEQ